MKVLYINGDIDDVIVNSFFAEFNKISIKEKITIYISSNGGYDHQSLAIIDLINNNANRIELVASGFIYSAAFNIFFFTKCKHRLLPETVGMAHYPKATFEINESGKATDEGGRFMIKEFKRTKAITMNNLKQIGLTTKELAEVRNSKECYLTYNRLIELLEYAKKDRS